MWSETDTIAAIATPEGEGGVSMIRVSGDGALSVFERCFARISSAPVESHRLYYGHVVDRDGRRMDEAMGVFMRAPNSYTRQDVCELHVHGGLMIARGVLNRVIREGVRLAEPGEFTKRAFLNGRIDLSEAEAVMALIQADSEGAARSAARQLEGGVSRFVLTLKQQLLELLALIEAGNNFPEEIEQQATASQVIEGAKRVREALIKASDETAARIVREGLSVALIGKPNVGKSSLLNALLQQERAIVTSAPGTTRDVLTERLRMGSLLIELSDTAGQREAQDEAERIGVERAKRAEASADVVLLVMDASNPTDEADRELISRVDRRTILVLNKTDLTDHTSKQHELPEDVPKARVCALTGEGIDALLQLIAGRFQAVYSEEQQMTQQRHIECAHRAIEALGMAIETAEGGAPIDLSSIDLMQALQALTEITGESASESVIERIFERFCVGK